MGIRNWFLALAAEIMRWPAIVPFLVPKELHPLAKRKGDKLECFDKTKSCDI